VLLLVTRVCLLHQEHCRFYCCIENRVVMCIVACNKVSRQCPMFDISCFFISGDVSPADAFKSGSVQYDNSQYQSQVIGPQTRSRASLS